MPDDRCDGIVQRRRSDMAPTEPEFECVAGDLASSLMVVHDFQFDWAETSLKSLKPLETDPPLVIDLDAPLPLTAVLERLQAVAGPHPSARAPRRIA